MLSGINPILDGRLLWILDSMGHSDAIVIADAHFPAASLARRLITLPTVSTPVLLAAVCTVIPLDASPALDLMQSADVDVEPVQLELTSAAGVSTGDVRFRERFEFYEAARSAFAVVRTGETRSYGNVILRKGLVEWSSTQEVTDPRAPSTRFP